MVTCWASGLFRKDQAVALFGDAVGEQHDVLERGVRGQHFAISLRQRGRDLRAAIGGDSGNQTLDEDLVFSAANGHVPLEGVVENQDADLIDGAQIFHYADGGLARQLDFLAFHGRRFVDDEHHGGAFRRPRRSEFGGQSAVQRIFRLLVFGVDIAFACDHQEAAALLHEILDLVFSGGGQRLHVQVV